ncbi:hypothetical protein [Streptomyces sp. NPDC005302]|uniref:hypothetical protein n=1 Tax=Streptomyces sp. NPDC005302 TaxID=3154675 RepID=UPI0033B977A4
MSALDDVRRALTQAYGTDPIFDGLTVDDLIKALVADEQLAVSAELREAADDLSDRIRTGGPRARGLVFARALLIARANGATAPAERISANHGQVDTQLRANPGVWLPVRDYSSRQSASSICWRIRNGGRGLNAYQPAGSFEARVEPTPDASRVFARFVGTAPEDGGQ